MGGAENLDVEGDVGDLDAANHDLAGAAADVEVDADDGVAKDLASVDAEAPSGVATTTGARPLRRAMSSPRRDTDMKWLSDIGVSACERVTFGPGGRRVGPGQVL